jgi:hypothetical protein
MSVFLSLFCRLQAQTDGHSLFFSLSLLLLQKYTPNFEGSKWRDMVVMTDADLEDKGVAALGARRKLLKVRLLLWLLSSFSAMADPAFLFVLP